MKQSSNDSHTQKAILLPVSRLQQRDVVNQSIPNKREPKWVRRCDTAGPNVRVHVMAACCWYTRDLVVSGALPVIMGYIVVLVNFAVLIRPAALHFSAHVSYLAAGAGTDDFEHPRCWVDVVADGNRPGNGLDAK